ncbi:hypothetical protein [Candidatus Raskinella chloraquaticus]|jgi:hypothetical protein|uniref:hypothetical protein n=1 Tax=Candidatus Raskinella chloraquaticus TaxID=1951219 RepID=UPI0026A723DE
MVRACAVPVLLLALLTSPAVNAQPVDHGLLAHERVRQQQVQGLVVPPPATITAPTPAQPRVDAGALYHQQVVKQQARGKVSPQTTVKPQ